MKLSNENIFFLETIKCLCNKSDFSRLEEVSHKVEDWNSFERSAINNNFGGLFYKLFVDSHKQNLIPDSVLNKFKSVYFKCLSRNISIYATFNKIIDLFFQNNIQIIALKGIYLAEFLFKDIGLRQLSDIDLLIKADDTEKCCDLLINAGYTFTFKSKKINILRQSHIDKHLPPFSKNGITIELHTRLNTTIQSYNIDVKECFERSVLTNINGIETFVLCPEDLAIHLLVHIDNHFKAGKITLNYFYDIVLLLNYFSDSFNWKAFEDTCKKYNCYEIVFGYLILVNKYFNINIPPDIFNNAKLTDNIKIENKFIIYINNEGINENENKVIPNIQSISKISGFSNKLFYLYGDLFPTKKFMIRNYKITNTKFVYFYYVLRIYKGIYKVIDFVFLKLLLFLKLKH